MLTLQELDKAPPGILYLYVTQRTFGPAGTAFRPTRGDLEQEQAACIINREQGGWMFGSKLMGQQLVQLVQDPRSAEALFGQYVQHPANANITLASRGADGTETVVDQSSTGAGSGSGWSIRQPGVIVSWAVLLVAIAMAVYFYRTRTVN
jgi:hypothetical protein